MDKTTKILVIVGAVAFAITAVILASVLLTKDLPFVTTVPYHKHCTSPGECPALECSNCMDCHLWQQRCVYSLKNSELCRCVEQETMPCVMDTGAPGKSVCTKVDKLHTKWSKCEALDVL